MNDLRTISIWIIWTISNFTFCRCLDWVQVKIIWLDIFAECFEHSCGETKLRFIVKESSIEHSFCWPIVIGAGVIDPVDSYFVPTEKDLNFTVEIAGQDPVYKFPRTCDKSPVESLSLSIGEKKKNDDVDDFDQNREDDDLTAVFSRGRCFNATVTLQTSKSLTSKKRPLASNMTAAQEMNGQGYEKVSDFLASWAPVPAWIVFMLVALNLALVSFLVIVLWITKKLNSSTKKNKKSPSNRRDHHHHSVLSSNITTTNKSSTSNSSDSPEFELKISKSLSDDTKYDLPWEQFIQEPGPKIPVKYSAASENFVKNERGIIVIKT